MGGLIQTKMDQVLDAIGVDRVVTADAVGRSVGLCERSVYRYVGRLRAAGHTILSEAGMGFMKPAPKRSKASPLTNATPVFVGYDLAGGPDIGISAFVTIEDGQLRIISFEEENMDPTYVQQEIDAKPEWKIAFILSELYNDNAPIGWSKFIPAAKKAIADGRGVERG